MKLVEPARLAQLPAGLGAARRPRGVESAAMLAALAVAVLAVLPQRPGAEKPRDLAALLRASPAAERMAAVLDDVHGHRLQIVLAEPVDGPDGSVVLRHSGLGDERQYFYPASTVKLCGAIAALLRLSAINREHGTAFGLDTPLAILPRFDGDELVDRDADNVDGGGLTVRSMLRKMLLVSDNLAFNHCFELAGPDGLNRTMWRGGAGSLRLWHRLSESRSLADNRRTRAVRLGVGDAALVLPARDAPIELDNGAFTELDVGDAYLSGSGRVDHAMSFAQKNAIALRDLQDVLVAVVRPEISTGKRGFPELSVEQRAFLVHTLGELPRESTNPRYDPAKIPDDYCKFVLEGVRRVVPAEHVRVYDKIGMAYGFVIENAYVEDRRTGRGFFLAIALYANPDGVLNDDAYGYDAIALPFCRDAGEVIARAVFG